MSQTFNSVVDLKFYRLDKPSGKSKCGNCDSPVQILGPRLPVPELPIYYLCENCGAIAQAGVGQVCPPDVPYTMGRLIRGENIDYKQA